MRCNICGYESDEYFSECPYCGNPVTSNRNNSSNLNQEFSNNNLNNSVNNVNNIHINKISELPKDAEKYFKVPFTSFMRTDNELQFSRMLGLGHFVTFFSLLFLGILIFVIAFLLCFSIPNFKQDILFFIVIILITILYPIFVYANIRVNSQGIFVKTIFKKIFIPRDKIEKCYYSTTKYKDRYGNVTKTYQTQILLFENYIFNTIFVNTGIGFSDPFPADYLAKEFNKYLGIGVISNKPKKEERFPTDDPFRHTYNR
jgi:hypothetical protein